MCTDVGVCVYVPSILMLSVSRMANDSLFSLPHHLFSLIFFSLLLFVTVPPPPIPSLPCLFFFISLYPLHYTSPLLPPPPQIDSLSTRGQTWPAHFGPAAHLSASVLCIQGERLMGPGDRERQGQRGRIREEDRGRGGVMLKGNIAVKVLH